MRSLKLVPMFKEEPYIEQLIEQTDQSKKPKKVVIFFSLEDLSADEEYGYKFLGGKKNNKKN